MNDKIFILKTITSENQLILTTPWFGIDLDNKDLNFTQILTHFNTILILKDVPSDWRGYRIEIELKPSLGFPNAIN